MEAVKQVTLADTIRGADVSLSKRGAYLAVFSNSTGSAQAIAAADIQKVRVLQVSTNRELTGPNWDSAIASEVVFSRDEKSLLCACADGSVEIRSLPDGKVVERIPPQMQAKAMTLALSPDGRLLAIGNREEDVILWDLERRQKLPGIAAAPLQYLSALAFSPDGATLWAAHAFGVLRWRVGDDGLYEPVSVGNEEFTSLSFSPDGRVLALGSADYRTRLWDLSASEWLAPLLQGDYVNCVAFSPDGHRVAAGGRDKVVRVWNTRFLETESRCRGTTRWQPPLAVSRDETVATCHREGDKYVLKLWKPGSPGERQVAVLPSAVEAVALSPDGMLLAAGDIDGTVRLWRVSSGELLRELKGSHQGSVLGMAFSPDGRLLVSGGRASGLVVWDLVTYQPRPLEGHDVDVLCVTFASNGLLGSAGGKWHDYGETFIWDLRESRPRCKIRHPRPVRCIAFSSDDRKIAATDDFSTGDIKIYDVESGHSLCSLLGHSSKTISLTFSEDGTRLLTGSDDGTIRFWDSASGEPVGTLRVDERVRKMFLLPDGCTLVTASWEGWVRVRRAAPASAIPHQPSRGFFVP